MCADLFFMNVFLQKFHRQLHFLFHRHLGNQFILHILKIKPHVHLHTYKIQATVFSACSTHTHTESHTDLSELTFLLQLPTSLVVHFIQTLTRLFVRVSLH